MSHTGLLRRYLIFFAGVLCSALGISLITLAGMGTSAVSSLAYVLTYVFPGVSLGTFTFVVNCVMLGGQILVLRKKFQPIQLLQIPATFVFSCCIDLWMSLLSGLIPQSYAGHWVVLLMGCTCLGLGVALEVIPNVLILPCEGFVRVCSQEFHWDFGKTKTGNFTNNLNNGNFVRADFGQNQIELGFLFNSSAGVGSGSSNSYRSSGGYAEFFFNSGHELGKLEYGKFADSVNDSIYFIRCHFNFLQNLILSV